MESASIVDAEQHAIYEHVSAVEYLRKAKEEEAHSDFQAAIDLAKKARDFANQAHARTLETTQRGSLGAVPAGALTPNLAPMQKKIVMPPGTAPPGSKL